jgi:hypothetical protein
MPRGGTSCPERILIVGNLNGTPEVCTTNDGEHATPRTPGEPRTPASCPEVTKDTFAATKYLVH